MELGIVTFPAWGTSNSWSVVNYITKIQKRPISANWLNHAMLEHNLFHMHFTVCLTFPLQLTCVY